MTHEMVPADEALARRSSMVVGGRPAAIVPQTMDDAYRLGKAICLAGMAPKGMDSPEKCMIAIMRGMEVGLTPMQALDKIAIVNGRPTIWGDGALGLVRGSGLCEYVKEWIEGEGDAMVAYCEAKRKGETDPVGRSFSVKEAKEAGLWGKQGPWQQFKRRMLAMRARAFCLRDLFADVLGGLYLKEELDNDGFAGPAPEPRRVDAPADFSPPIEQQFVPAAPERLAERRRAPSASQQPAKAGPPPSTHGYHPDRVLAAFEKAAIAAADRAALNDAWEQIVGPHWDTDALPTGHPDRDDLDALYRWHGARVDGEEGAEP